MAGLFGSISPWAILFTVLGLLFQVWPALLIAPLQQKGNGLSSVVGMWVILALIRIVILLDPEPLLATLFWADPLRTSLFVFVGTLLAAGYLGKRLLGRSPAR